MNTFAVAHALYLLAADGGGRHDSLHPILTGGGAFLVLLLLLWITTRFNRD